MRASTADVRRKYGRKWDRAQIPSESGRGAIEHRGGPPESGGADMEVCYSYMRKARSLKVGASTASVGQSVGHAGGCRVAAVRKARRALERRSAQRAEGWCERGGCVAVATQVGDDNARVRRANAGASSSAAECLRRARQWKRQPVSSADGDGFARRADDGWSAAGD